MMTAPPTAVPKDEQRSVIQFLTQENVLGSEIHARTCVVYGVLNVTAESTVNQWVQIQGRTTNLSDKCQSGRPWKRGTWYGIPQIGKMPCQV